MTPFHFGRTHEPMYGVAHEPAAGSQRQSAVLLCNSIAHEYIRGYQALRKLADALAANGYFVLRFDYRFTGDSAGSFAGLRLTEIDRDIQDASEELLALSGCRKVVGIGLRLGALFLLRSSHAGQFSRLILWDPVLSGLRHIAELRRMQSDLLASSYYYARARSTADTAPNELLGYIYSDALIEDLKAAVIEPPLASPSIVHTVLSGTSEKSSDQTSDPLRLVVPDMGGWSSIFAIEQLLSTHKIEQQIISLVTSHA